MADKKEDKIILEREYIVPLRKKFIDTPFYKKTPKAIKALKQFIAKHMKIEDRDIRKVKLDKYVNEEIWSRGIRKPLNKIRIKAKKFESGIVKVELVEIPEFIKWKISKEKKKLEAGKEKEEKKPEEKVEVKKEEKTEEEKKAVEEKKDAVKEAGLKQAETQAKQVKHEARTKQGPKHQRRMALQK